MLFFVRKIKMKFKKKIIKGMILIVTLIIIHLVNAGTDLTDVSYLLFEGHIYDSNNVRGGIVPKGMIAIFNGSCPTGWTQETGYEGYFIRGDDLANFGGTGGNANHDHTVSGTTDVGTNHTHTLGPITRDLDAESSHTHSFNDTISSTTGAGSAHSHGAGSYTANAHTHGAGTLVHVHTHSYDTPADTSTYASVTKPAGATADTVCPDHTHSVDPGAVTSGAASATALSGDTASGGGDAITGSTADESSHTHGITDYTGHGIMGTTSHTHSVTIPQQYVLGEESHTHGVGTYDFAAQDNLPSYTNVVLCSKD